MEALSKYYTQKETHDDKQTPMLRSIRLNLEQRTSVKAHKNCNLDCL